MFDKPRTPEMEERQRLVDNRAWLNANFTTLQKEYGDRWIAVVDQAVVVSDTDVETVKQAVAERISEAVVLRVPAGAIPRPQ
jgi:hypothetical protein